MSVNPQLGDVGVEFIATISTCDCTGKVIPLDVSTQTLKKICFKKPDTSIVEFDAEFTLPPCGLGTGVDGKLSYITQAGDLDQAGTWSIAAHVTLVGGQDLRTSPQIFKVETPICP